ncbi:hypothetical protein UNSW2_747 [Campylobacter concisus UNSW2]|uniref:Uncharacterized protein n=1 Tax=Campylobacter concisus UNSW2 TaxID=1242965 RepID=U2F7S1_9BACT|nr:hypothetical protein UNSW2_747 [Campylobacter concisus UNSW2]
MAFKFGCCLCSQNPRIYHYFLKNLKKSNTKKEKFQLI